MRDEGKTAGFWGGAKASRRRGAAAALALMAAGALAGCDPAPKPTAPGDAPAPIPAGGEAPPSPPANDQGDSAPSPGGSDPAAPGEDAPGSGDPNGAGGETAPDAPPPGEPNIDPEPAPAPEPAPEPSTDAIPTPAPEPSPEPAPEPAPQPDPAPQPEPAPAPTPEPIPDPLAVRLGPNGFAYHPPGQLLPNTGQGVADETIYAPDIVFPVRRARAILGSQVHNPGGGAAGGDQCDARNYDYPWRDNFCETRSRERSSLNCPSTRIHQGVDIRAGDAAGCRRMRALPQAEHNLYEVVAVDDGFISNVGSFTVDLTANGRIYRYLHLNMTRLQVKTGDAVAKGQMIGYLSNFFGTTPTTFHLHFEIKQNMGSNRWAWVSPYMSLARAYERREAAALAEQTPVDIAGVQGQAP